MKSQKKLLFLLSILLLSGCKEEVASQSDLANLKVQQASSTSLINKRPRDEIIAEEMQKETNRLEVLLYGLYDQVEISFAQLTEDYDLDKYLLTDKQQQELLTLLKSIELKLIEEQQHDPLYTYDFMIVRPRFAYVNGPWAAVNIDENKFVYGFENIFPNTYEVINGEEIFEKLQALFDQSVKEES